MTVCTDTPGKLAEGRTRHGLSGSFLADPELVVTDAFGLRNANMTVRPPGLPGLPIPTTLLFDRTGKLVWKDQSPDYMQRSDPQTVRAVLQKYL